MKIYKNIYGYFQKEKNPDTEMEYEVPNDTIPNLLSASDFENGVFVGEHYYQVIKERELICSENALKSELIKIREDIEQVDLFGIVRDDIADKRKRAAEIINELRVLEGKSPRA